MEITRLVSGKLSNNTFVVFSDNKNECILIDAAAPLEEVKKAVGKNKLLGVFLTHGHFDHVENLDSIINFYKVPCYIYKTEVEKLYKPLLNYCRVFYTSYTTTLPRNAFVLLEDDQTVELSNFAINTTLTKGHTDGSVCYLVNETLLFTGDTMFENTYGRTDFYDGNIDEMFKSLDLLEMYVKDGYILCPGH